MGLDIQSIRSEFPILSREINGHQLAYLDNAASAQQPTVVMEALKAQSERAYANVHRGLHTLCLLYTSPSPRDATLSRMPSSA